MITIAGATKAAAKPTFAPISAETIETIAVLFSGD